ncbi:glycosyltransferase [Clostridium sp. C105KSO13]|uniref:glycosyltransferase n=1 Tax=Clostridium sp. C105KSO13 TaxID=1776045 RepID=UPI0007406AA5|nr:glycosyltransferase [Clostridium sp. C105KSO13]CUX40668.1 Alpha-monoglucosyldiacylglycerol synthase [Clostridium sp. C105KSO13]
MRIAMLTNNYSPFVGGVPISVERQAKELAKRGHSVTVFAPEYGQKEDEKQTTLQLGKKDRNCIDVIRYQTGMYKLENGMVCPKVIIKEILQTFERKMFDCIHVHHPMFVGPVALYLGKKYDLPVIYTYHTKYEDYLHYLRLFRTMEKNKAVGRKIFRLSKEKLIPKYITWFTNQCDLVLTPTASMQEIIKERGTKTATAILPTGLEDSFYIQDQEEAKMLRKEYLGGKTHLFCTVSRLEKEKNPEFILRGSAKLKEKIGDTFRLLFIGEGSMRNRLEQMTEELGISEEVLFLGNIENERIKNYISACELFLFASKSETQGIVLAEALAAGSPVVAVQATGVEDIVVSGQNGYMTKEDTEEWTEKIIEALKKENYGKLKEQAQSDAGRFKASRLAVYEEQLYEQCMRAKGERKSAYEDEAGWPEHSGALIYRIFKAS